MRLVHCYPMHTHKDAHVRTYVYMRSHIVGRGMNLSEILPTHTQKHSKISVTEGVTLLSHNCFYPGCQVSHSSPMCSAQSRLLKYVAQFMYPVSLQIHYMCSEKSGFMAIVYLNGWFAQSNLYCIGFLSATPALLHLFPSRWLSSQ